MEDQSTGSVSAGGYPGLVGVIQPLSALDTSMVLGNKYVGFRFEPKLSIQTQPVAFGPGAAPTLGIVGGAYPNDDLTSVPTTDTTITLGTQDPANNGLYESATITIPDPAQACGSGATCMLPAVAVVGNPDSKFAIFLIAQNRVSNTPIALYLFQQ